MMKNAIDVLTGGFSFWMFGFGLSYGEGSLRRVNMENFLHQQIYIFNSIQQSILWLGKIFCRCRWFWFSNGRDLLLIFLSICVRRNRSIWGNKEKLWLSIFRNHHHFRSHCGAYKLLFLHHLLGVQHVCLLPARPLAVGGDGLPQDDGRGGPGRQLRRQPRGRGRRLRGWEAAKYWHQNSLHKNVKVKLDGHLYQALSLIIIHWQHKQERKLCTQQIKMLRVGFGVLYIFPSCEDARSTDWAVGQQQGAGHGERHQHHYWGLHAMVGLDRLQSGEV